MLQYNERSERSNIKNKRVDEDWDFFFRQESMGSISQEITYFTALRNILCSSRYGMECQ